MKLSMLGAVTAVALVGSLGMASAANAATFIDPPTDMDPMGTFGNTDPDDTFLDVFTFSTSTPGFLTVTLFSEFVEISENVNFVTNGVTLNGTNLTVINRGNPEIQELILGLTPGTQTLSIAGSAGPNGSYNGTLSFVAGAIPEPSTWALMILGFGAIGFGMRRKKKQAQVSYSF